MPCKAGLQASLSAVCLLCGCHLFVAALPPNCRQRVECKSGRHPHRPFLTRSWPFAILDDDQVMKLLDLQHPSPLLDSALQQQQRQVEAQLATQRAQQEAAAQQAQQAEQQRQMEAAAALQQVQQARQQQPPVARLLPQLVAGVPASLRPPQQQGLAPGATTQQPPVPQLLPAGAHVPPAPAGPQAGQASRLQLSEAIGSPTAAAAAGLGSIVSAMELGSPPAGAALAAAGGGSGPGAALVAAAQQQQQQQPQLRQAGVPTLAPAGGIKLEPEVAAIGAPAAVASATVPPQLQLAAGWPVMGGYPGGSAAQQQQLPHLRPAAAATLQQFEQQQQLQQQAAQPQQVLPQQSWAQQPMQQQQQPVLRPAMPTAPTLQPAQVPR